MSTNPLVPLFYDGQDRQTEPVALKSHQDIKAERKQGLLNGWYQENGRIFVLYRPKHIDINSLEMVAGSGFDSAWGIMQSGYAGPNTWQLKTSKGVVDTA